MLISSSSLILVFGGLVASVVLWTFGFHGFFCLVGLTLPWFVSSCYNFIRSGGESSGERVLHGGQRYPGNGMIPRTCPTVRAICYLIQRGHQHSQDDGVVRGY